MKSEHRRMLTRRLEHLRSRIETGLGSYDAINYMKSEASALEEALKEEQEWRTLRRLTATTRKDSKVTTARKTLGLPQEGGK